MSVRILFPTALENEMRIFQCTTVILQRNIILGRSKNRRMHRNLSGTKILTHLSPGFRDFLRGTRTNSGAPFSHSIASEYYR